MNDIEQDEDDDLVFRQSAISKVNDKRETFVSQLEVCNTVVQDADKPAETTKVANLIKYEPKESKA